MFTIPVSFFLKYFVKKCLSNPQTINKMNALVGEPIEPLKYPLNISKD